VLLLPADLAAFTPLLTWAATSTPTDNRNQAQGLCFRQQRSTEISAFEKKVFASIQLELPSGLPNPLFSMLFWPACCYRWVFQSRLPTIIMHTYCRWCSEGWLNGT
jgi:hypothetical protein